MIRRIQPFALIAALALAGCATAPSQEPGAGEAEPTTEEEAAAAGAEGTDAADTGTGTGVAATAAADCPPNCDFARDAVEDESSALSDRTIYFAFDSSRVDDEYMPIIERHAAYLTQYPDVELRLEGHTDERGSREYNVGLGARRAESVAQLLQAYGVASGQITTVSYGEEVPAVEGHNEEAWSKNRRVELVYPASGG
ncbi:MAG: peptidoglycan-associated lipoprotein Pal [Halofilum sp. (in: g-proteobacteria)]|nr:peptidoglycan-associated lipoprotein Pal [Halofilum sp. (in: g-proteobacteria)]